MVDAGKTRSSRDPSPASAAPAPPDHRPGDRLGAVILVSGIVIGGGGTDPGAERSDRPA